MQPVLWLALVSREGRMEVGIDMGTAPGAAPAMLDLEELLATRLLVQGNSGSGKSHLLRRLLEQSAPWVQQCVIDPEGDFVTLADRFAHVVVDAARPEAELVRIAGRIRQHRVSVVLTLEGLDAEQQMRCAAAFLSGMFEAEREYWYPMLVVVDEAQLFAPAVGGEVAEDARRLSLGAMTNLMCRGRKRGLAGVIATQRLAKLAKNVAAEASNFLMGRTFLDIDMARAADLLGMERRQADQFRDLARGTFVALGPAIARRPLAVTIGPVVTEARSVSPRLMPLPQTPPQDAAALVFTPGPEEKPAPAFRRARPAPPTVPTSDILAQLAASREAADAADGADENGLDEADRDALVAAILHEMAQDSGAGFRTDAVLYQDFLVRCRIRRLPGPPLPLSQFRRQWAVARADVDDETARSPAWQQALQVSQGLADELQAVFLVVAQAAVRGLPCPSDGELALVYGTHSPRRLRRLLTYFEEHGLIVLRTDSRGLRVVAFPDLDCETAPGDAAADRVGARDAAE